MLKIKLNLGKNNIPILSAATIDHLAQQILSDYNHEQVKEARPLDMDEFLELYLEMEKDYQHLSHNKSILGMTAFCTSKITVYDAENNNIKDIVVNEGIALIDLSLTEKGQEQRERFTSAHESSHWILHQDPFINRNVPVSCRSADIEQCGRRSLKTDNDWIEWQADYMASALLMPVNTFKMAFFKLCREAGIRKTQISLGMNADNDLFAELLPDMLSEIFSVSKRSASIRLKKLGLIVGSENFKKVVTM